MVVSQGLALATTEAAMYLYQSAQSLWRAWQASAHLQLEPHYNPMLHPTSFPTDTSAEPASLQQNGLTGRLATDLSALSDTLQPSPTQWAPSQLQDGLLRTQSVVRASSAERTQPLMGSLSGTCQQGQENASHRVCDLLERSEAALAVISQTADPAKAITLLLPLGILVMGGLTAAWSRCGMPLPRLWLVRIPLLVSVAGKPSSRPFLREFTRHVT